MQLLDDDPRNMRNTRQNKELRNATIVICTLGFNSLFKTLESIYENTFTIGRNIEVLVIGNANKKKINHYKKIMFLKYIPVHYELGDLSKKRNLGLEHAESDVVAFIDDDVEIPEGWLEKGIKHFEDTKVGIVSGPGVIPPNTSFSSKVFGNTLASLGALPIRKRYIKSGKLERDYEGTKVIGCNFWVRKSLYPEIKFDPDMIPAEEIKFASETIKKGWKVYRDPNLFLYHYARSSLWKFCKQIFRFGMSKTQSIKKGVVKPSFVYLLPPMCLVLLPILFIFSIWSETSRYFLISAIFLYFLGVVITVAVSFYETKDLSSILLIFTIPIMHICYGLGEIYGREYVTVS